MPEPVLDAGISSLPPIVIPAGNPMVPDWAIEAIRRLNLITGATIGMAPSAGGYGASAFAFSDANAKLLIPGGTTMGVPFLSAGKTMNGLITVQDGIVTDVTPPS